MNVTGYYGKLPQRGDFVSRRVPETFKTVWDDWAQQLVRVCNDVSEKATSNQWFRLPIYRFYLSEGIAGDNAWIGLMLPSQDSVGRKFPLCFARSTHPDCTYPQLNQHEQEFFTNLELIVEAVFCEELDFDSIGEKLTKLDTDFPTMADSSENSLSIQSVEPSLCLRLITPQDESVALWESAFDATLRATCSAYSVWQTSPLSQSTRETLVCEALPSADCCKSFFDGRFQKKLWTQKSGFKIEDDHREENKLGVLGNQSVDIQAYSNEGNLPLNYKTLYDPNKTDNLDLDETEPLDAPWEQ